MIQKNGDKPFQINIYSSDINKLKELGSIKSERYTSNLFFIPEGYEEQIKEYNEYVKKEIEKNAADEFAKGVQNINYN